MRITGRERCGSDQYEVAVEHHIRLWTTSMIEQVNQERSLYFSIFNLQRHYPERTSVNQVIRGTLLGDQIYRNHFNLRGDQGSHILVSIVWSYDSSADTWTLTKKAKCL